MAEKTIKEILGELSKQERRARKISEQVSSDDIRKPPDAGNWTLILHHEGEPAKQFSLVRSLQIGRSTGSDVPLLDRRISRQHARIDLVEGKPRIVDLGSNNGTYVNGARIEGAVWLDAGDEVTICDFRMSVSPGSDEDIEKTGDFGFSIKLPVQPG